jgi:hypothetical protein
VVVQASRADVIPLQLEWRNATQVLPNVTPAVERWGRGYLAADCGAILTIVAAGAHPMRDHKFLPPAAASGMPRRCCQPCEVLAAEQPGVVAEKRAPISLGFLGSPHAEAHS